MVFPITISVICYEVGTYRSYIGLMDVQSVSGNMQYSFGAINMHGALIANRYHYSYFAQYE